MVCCTVYCIWEGLYAWKDEAYVHVYVDVDAMSMFVSCLIFSYIWAYVYLMKCMIFWREQITRALDYLDSIWKRRFVCCR